MKFIIKKKYLKYKPVIFEISNVYIDFFGKQLPIKIPIKKKILKQENYNEEIIKLDVY